MNITFDDPCLTAYALDELDEAGRTVIESEMQNFGECRREVEELTRAVALVHDGLASELAPALLPVQQRAIEAKLKLSGSKPKLSWIPSTENGSLNWLLKTALAVAVALLMSVVQIPVILLVASLLLGNLYLRLPWKRLLLTLFVIPLVIVREGLRMFTVAELCVHLSGEAMIDSPIFHYGSLIFFALSLIPFVFFLVWLRKLESKP